MFAFTLLTYSITSALSIDVTPSAFRTLPPSALVPPLPGRHRTSPTNGDIASDTASACSRPPFPTSTTVSERAVVGFSCDAAASSRSDSAVSVAWAALDRRSERRTRDARRASSSSASASASDADTPKKDPALESYATRR